VEVRPKLADQTPSAYVPARLKQQRLREQLVKPSTSTPAATTGKRKKSVYPFEPHLPSASLCSSTPHPLSLLALFSFLPCPFRSDKSSDKSNPFALGSHLKTAAEDDANERRKKRFAREHDIESSRNGGGEPMMVPRTAQTKMEQLSLNGKGGGVVGKGKKFGKGRIGLPEEEKMFDPVSLPSFTKRTGRGGNVLS
jgi:hypothetical protein